ncbi:polysaccharide deacetylase family protein [Solwaraspora sp. WMMD1047]|uniref:polysaccharide deacetylase family protein n=1 Tax=Solwaraspora sp. WMMD1047 TaxID=3016102 RepID=UPI0024168526|nr:polysaccharide deacetylase family protein [Solwaraspora sp. WMMD1047]MDG4827816.1 polysaccharide deacetylase family protein [Solwaraspora sp. WMMD1047]
MPKRPAFVGGVALLVMLTGGYATTALRSDTDAQPWLTRPAATVPNLPPESVPADPPDVADPTPAPATKPAPRGKVGPHGTQRLTGKKQVAVTFDDGPDPQWTPKVLDSLRAAKVKATFCLVGSKVRSHPALVVRIVREGHSLCNHSWQHDLKLGEKPEPEIASDLARTNRQIQQAVPGAEIDWYRQPGGKWTPAVIKVAREQGMAALHWDVDPADWEKPGAAVIAKRVANQARPGSIVLLHDGGGDRSGTVGACPGMLRSLRAKYGILRLK